MQALQERDVSAQRTAPGIERSPKWSAVSATESNNRYDLHRERLPTFPRTNAICTRYKRHLYGERMPTYLSSFYNSEKLRDGKRQEPQGGNATSVRH